MSLAPSASRRAALGIGARSSWVSGSRSSGRPPSAWRARKPVERGFGAAKRRVQGLVGDAVRPDVLFERAVDGLDDGHGRCLREIICQFAAARNGRNNAGADYSVPLEVSPLGRPATVTSMPPP